jgi:hypothetical protein
LALGFVAAIPTANALPDQTIVVFGGGGGGGGGSLGNATYPAGSGGEGGRTGQVDVSLPPLTAGLAGTNGTNGPDPDQVGDDGEGGLGAKGGYYIGSVKTDGPAGLGQSDRTGGPGGSGTYGHSASEATTAPSLAVVGGDGGSGGCAAINAGGAGGAGGSAIAEFWRTDVNASIRYFPNALVVSGEILVRSGLRGTLGESSFNPDQTFRREGGRAGAAGGADLRVHGTLKANSLNVIKRDGGVGVRVGKLLVQNGETTTVTLDGTSNTSTDVVFDNIEVQEGGTLIIDDRKGQFAVEDDFIVEPGATVVILDPSNADGEAAPAALAATATLSSPVRLPSGGGKFTLPLTGTGLTNVQVKAFADGRAVEIAGSGSALRSATAAALPVEFPANTAPADATYPLLVGNGSGVWTLLNLVVTVAGASSGGQLLPFAVAGTPAIAGTPAVGSTLTADPGAWVPQPSFSYYWLRDGVAIGGSHGATYVVAAADVGTTLSVRLTGSGPGLESTSRESTGVRIPVPLDHSGGNDDSPGDNNGSTGGDGTDGGDGKTGGDGTDGGNGTGGSNGTGGGSDTGGQNGGQSMVPLDSNPVLPTDVGSWATGVVTTGQGLVTLFLGVSGDARVGRVLTARVVASSPVPTIAYSYQWLRGGAAIANANAATYTLKAADRAKKISVRLTATPVGQAPTVVTSAETVAKTGALKTTRPKLVGVTKVGRTLKASATKWTAGAKKKYQWYRDGKRIAKATRVTYVLKAADAGKRINVKVTATKAGYKKVVRASVSKRARW